MILSSLSYQPSLPKFCSRRMNYTNLGRFIQQYETDSNDVRHRFEEHGEIKTFFDLISNRGMVFVTYVSIGPPTTQ